MIEFLLGVVVGSIGGMTLMAMFASDRKCRDISDEKDDTD
jgi:hypothetical protein